MAKLRYTKVQVIKALQKSYGLTTYAARKLGCDYHTIQNYINRFKSVRKAHKEAIEVTSDKAESNIIKAIENGDLKISMWYLKYNREPYQGKEKHEFQGKIVVSLPKEMKIEQSN